MSPPKVGALPGSSEKAQKPSRNDRTTIKWFWTPLIRPQKPSKTAPYRYASADRFLDRPRIKGMGRGEGGLLLSRDPIAAGPIAPGVGPIRDPPAARQEVIMYMYSMG